MGERPGMYSDHKKMNSAYGQGKGCPSFQPKVSFLGLERLLSLESGPTGLIPLHFRLLYLGTLSYKLIVM